MSDQSFSSFSDDFDHRIGKIAPCARRESNKNDATPFVACLRRPIDQSPCPLVIKMQLVATARSLTSSSSSRGDTSAIATTS
jgi:hypothetical protein